MTWILLVLCFISNTQVHTELTQETIDCQVHRSVSYDLKILSVRMIKILASYESYNQRKIRLKNIKTNES